MSPDNELKLTKPGKDEASQLNSSVGPTRKWKGMKLTNVERIGRSRLIPGIGRTVVEKIAAEVHGICRQIAT